MKGLSKGVLNVVKSKTGKSISEQTINRLASRVTPKTMQSDSQLRSLILEVAKAVNVKVPEATVQSIIRMIKQSGNVSALEQMINAMVKK
jgi:hypothetical protein